MTTTTLTNLTDTTNLDDEIRTTLRNEIGRASMLMLERNLSSHVFTFKVFGIEVWASLWTAACIGTDKSGVHLDVRTMFDGTKSFGTEEHGSSYREAAAIVIAENVRMAQM